MSAVLIAVVSGKGSPGASTSALAMTLGWPGSVLLVDADPRGGDLLWGFGRGQHSPGTGLLSFQVNTRRAATSVDALWPATVQLDEIRWALPGVDESRQSGSVDWASLARALRSVPDGVDVVVDCGVVPAHRAPSAIWAAADLVVVVTRSSLKSTRAALNAAGLVRTDLMANGWGAERLMSVVVGAGRPYSFNDVSQALASVAGVVGELPWEPGAAATLSDGETSRKRELARLTSAAGVVSRAIVARVQGLPPAAPAGMAVAENGTLGGPLTSSVRSFGSVDTPAHSMQVNGSRNGSS